MEKVHISKINVGSKKIVIDDLVTSFSNSIYNHKAAWPKVIQSIFKHHGVDATLLTGSGFGHEVLEYDIWYISLPMEYIDVYNLFGGADEKTYQRTKRFLDFKGEIYFEREPVGLSSKFISQRKGLASTYKDWNTLDEDKFEHKLQQCKILDITLPNTGLSVGDSHTVSIWTPGWNISRTDGKTLNGIIKKVNGKSFLEEKICEYTPTQVHVSAGNIDIRHHILRKENPKEYCDELAKKVADEFMYLENTYNLPKIKIQEPLPIEHEDRKIPKTGYFKGTPFYGTQQERSYIRNYLTERLLHYLSFDRISFWPKEWYELSPEQFAVQHMERPKSVHLAQVSYLHPLVKIDPEEQKQHKKKIQIANLF